MIKFGQDISTGTELSTQVCIVGTGAAGITLAWTLIKGGVKVILIDGGRFNMGTDREYEDKELFYNGEAVGLFKDNEPQFLIRSTDQFSGAPSERELTYGGTTTHWGGQCRPLDPIDFEDYEGYPGWPISRASLDTYYSRAARFCMLHGDNFDTDFWAKCLSADVPKLTGFDVEMYQFIGDAYKRFQERKVDNQTIGQSAACVIRNATLLDIDFEGRNVKRLKVASLSMGADNPPKKATEFTIKADAYVLATGSVANARLLLLSKAANSSGNVGKYFMCHPLVVDYVDFRGNPVIINGQFLTGREENLLFGKSGNGLPWKDSNGVTVEGRFIPSADTARENKIGRCWFWPTSGGVYFQQAANEKSHVELSDQRDPVFDQQLTHIDWQFNDFDEKTYKRTTELFRTAATEAAKRIKNKVTLKFATWEEIKSRVVVNGHHLGTTRMSKKPADGVVNEDLRTHDLDNLYVAGASVFPCAGISNPTFTIITLSIRLADHLTTVLRGGKRG